MKEERDPKFFLMHILESIAEIEKSTENISKDEFFDTIQIQDAVVRRLEIIGEAVKNLPISFKNQYPKTPWKKIAGLRDVLIHEYFGVDINLVWKIVNKNIPKFKKQISELLEKF